MKNTPFRRMLMTHVSISTLSLVLFALAATSISAQSLTSLASISGILNPDGSVRSGVSGSFDPSGFQMAKGVNGEPKFVTSDKSEGGCSDGWDTNFTTAGANGQINVIVSDGAGNLYFGGRFTAIGNILANRIAKWDGTTWTAFGAGISFNEVNAIAILGTDIYVGGDFSHVNGTATQARNVAKWNGTTWSPLLNGLGGGTHIVRTALVDNGEVVFGGSFFMTAGAPATGIARWNGTAWSNAGTLNPTANSIVFKDGIMYAGSGSGVAKWEGGAWVQLGDLTGEVNKIAFRGNELWAIGSLRLPGNNNISIARWNGTAWVNPVFFQNVRMNTLLVDGTNVYVGGNFTRLGGQNTTDGVMKFDGSTWSALGTGTQGNQHEVMTMLPVGNTIYMGGNFLRAGGVGAQNLALLTNGSTWSALPSTGLDGEASAIASYGNDIYVGGRFISAGQLTANRIAKWNNTTGTWSTLGAGFVSQFSESEYISTIAVANGKVYAGGNFQRAGTANANNIAVWDGNAWSAMGSGVNGQVTAILIKGDDVYVGGNFSTAGGIPAQYIAKWNGTAWSSLGTTPIPSTVNTLGSIGNDIYVTSNYTTLDGPNYLLKYDGTTWTPLTAGMTMGGADSMAIVGNNIYVAGMFNSIGSVPASRIARWDGTAWNTVPNDLPLNTNPRVHAAGSDVILYGDYTTLNGATMNGIARFDGTNWHPMGSGLSGGRGAKAHAAGGSIFATGAFLTAGCRNSAYFARYRRTIWTGATSADWHTTSNWSDNSVPPAGAGVTISANDASITSANATVSTLTVTNSKTITIGAGRTLTVTGNLDLRDGFVTGTGTLIVNGEIIMSGGSISNLASLTVDQNLSITGGNVTSVGTILAKRDLIISGNITGASSITVNRDFWLTGNVSGGGSVSVLNDMNFGTGAITNPSSVNVARNLSLTGGNISGAASINVGGVLSMGTGNITGTGMVTLTSCQASALIGGSSSSYIASPLTRCVNGSGNYRFPVAFGATFSEIALSNTTGTGNVTVEAKAGPHANATGLSPNRLQRWWSTSATGTLKADVTLAYLHGDVVGNEDHYRGFGISGGTATRIQTTLNATGNNATLFGVTSFAAFTLAEADSVLVPMNGRLIARGRGAEHVEITMTDSFGNVYVTKTNQMGFFRFGNLPTIRQYTFAFKSKRFQLTPRGVWFDGDPLLTVVGP